MSNTTAELFRPEMPVLIGTVSGDETYREIEEASCTVGMFELRGDFDDEQTVESIGYKVARLRYLSDSSIPILLTLRAMSEGGKWRDDDRRFDVFAGLVNKIDMVDAELLTPGFSDAVIDLAESAGKPAMVSVHEFGGTSEGSTLDEYVALYKQSRASVLKVATLVEDESSYGRHTNFEVRHRNDRVATVPMGDYWVVLDEGEETERFVPARQAVLPLGTVAAYGYVGDKPAAPGQLSSSEMYDAMLQEVPS